MSLALRPEPASKPRGIDAIYARLASSVAWWVSMLPPRHIFRLLQAVVKDVAPATLDEAERARAFICSVSTRCAGQGCLQRSIAVVLYCRVGGRGPSWKTGYQTSPFRAHAWVEVDGNPVTEPPEVARFLPVLEVHPPGTSHLPSSKNGA